MLQPYKTYQENINQQKKQNNTAFVSSIPWSEFFHTSPLQP